jgi:hypothetical protein
MKEIGALAQWWRLRCVMVHQRIIDHPVHSLKKNFDYLKKALNVSSFNARHMRTPIASPPRQKQKK